MQLDLRGRTALVTGATGDIGAAIAELLAAEGVHVRVNGRSEERLSALVARITAAGGSAEAMAGDLTQSATIERLVSESQPPDLFVHAAAHRFQYARLASAPAEDVAQIYAADLHAFSSLCTRMLRGQVRKRHGRIVAVSSLAAQLGGAGGAHYAAAKAGLEGLVRGIACDYGPFGITANVVAPGFVATTRMEERLQTGNRERLESATSLRRLATPEEIARPVVFLCSSAASYITGATLMVSGGAHLANLW